MANIKNMEMAAKLISLDNIELQKKFFGLSSKYVYTPTGSELKGEYREYKSEEERALMTIINGSIGETQELANGYLTDHAATLGALRLDVCTTADKQFAALQLFRYDQYIYKPLCEVKTFAGAKAQEIYRLL